MRTVCILSHSRFELYARAEHDLDFVAVVVYSHDKDAPYVEDSPQMLDLLFEQFDDVDDPEDGMSSEQAEEIASFVFEYEEQDVDLVVSCRYGESRSAGIAAAIAAYLGQDELEIFDDPDKIPNMHCYALTCEALGVERSEDEIRQRFLINANAK